MTKKETLVLDVTPETEVVYNGQAIAFYDNPRELKDEKGKVITEKRLYISIDNIGQRQKVRRKVADFEREGLCNKYDRAYNLYLAAKKAGGRLSETSKLVDTIADKNKLIENKAKELTSKEAEIAELHRKIAEFEASKVKEKTNKEG